MQFISGDCVSLDSTIPFTSYGFETDYTAERVKEIDTITIAVDSGAAQLQKTDNVSANFPVASEIENAEQEICEVGIELRQCLCSELKGKIFENLEKHLTANNLKQDACVYLVLYVPRDSILSIDHTANEDKDNLSNDQCLPDELLLLESVTKITADVPKTIDLLKEPETSNALVRQQFEGQKNETVKLQLLDISKPGSSGRLHATLQFKWKHFRNRMIFFYKPGLKHEFDLRDASAKVITLLSRITYSNKWACCSPNTYGKNQKDFLRLFF